MDVSKLCRSCMKAVASWEVENFDQRAVDMFTFCTNIEVADEDKLPKQFCYDCIIKIESSFTYIKKAQEVNVTLKNLVSRKLTSIIVKMENHDKNFSNTINYNNVEENKINSMEATYFFNNTPPIINENESHDMETLNQALDLLPETTNLPQSKFFDQSPSELIEEITTEDQNGKVCPVCRLMFKSENSLANHIHDTHLQKEEQRSDDRLEIEIFEGHINGSVRSINYDESLFQKPSPRLRSRNEIKDMNIQNVELSNMEIQMNSPSNKLSCSICHKSFLSEKWLDKHTKSKHDNHDTIQVDENDFTNTHQNTEETKTCTLCDKSFTKQTWLMKHMQKVHAEPEPYSQPACPSSLRPQPPVQQRRFECGSCGARFAKRKQLAAHRVRHDDARPFACHRCDKRFKQKSVLAGHLKLHEETRLFLCDVCGASFKRLHTLQTHAHRHASLRPYACAQCAFRGAAPATLRAHRHRHERRVLLCAHCHRAFSDRSALDRHTRIHTGDRPYQCLLCPLRFVDSWKCKTHMMRSHGLTLAEIPALRKSAAAGGQAVTG